MKPADLQVERGREAFERSSWNDAHAALSAAEADLSPADLWRLALSSYLLGRGEDFLRAAATATAYEHDLVGSATASPGGRYPEP